MGATIDVETTIGRGSTFWVELPVVEGPVERYERLGRSTVTATSESPADRRHSIVYIEDNLSNLRLIDQLLTRRGGIELVAAMQGRLGLDLVRQHHPLAVLLDLHLPDVDGEDVLRELRDDPGTANIPVIILSADATPTHVQRLLASGAHAYLTKPVDIRQLLATLEAIIAEAELP
jgi:CheY-like chemotaxis protein